MTMRRVTAMIRIAASVLLTACAGRDVTVQPAGPAYRARMVEAAPAPATAYLAEVDGAADAMAARPDPDPDVLYTVTARLTGPGATGPSLAAPRLVVFAGQAAAVTITNPTSYIHDFDVETAEGAYVVDPIVGILRDGLALDLLVLPEPDGDAVLLGLEMDHRKLLRPLPVRRMVLAEGTDEVTLQLPAVELRRLAVVRHLALGEELVAARLAGTRESPAMELRLRVDRTPVDPGVVAEGGAEDAAGTRSEPPELRRMTVRAQGADDVDVRAELVAVRGAPRGGTRAWSLGRRRNASDLAGGEVLASLELSGRRVPGTEAATRLQEAFVASRRAHDTGRQRVYDPEVDTVVSGVSAELTDDGRLLVRWETTPEWETHGRFAADRSTVEQPERHRAAAAVDLDVGEWFVPLARMEDGRTAGVRLHVR